MNAAALIFSNIHDASLPELTEMRTMASVPFGCRYRLIDFPLSNLVNADITNVGIITHYNYQSLIDHIGTGKDWDLARRSGGIRILSPFITAFENSASGKVYTTRLEALMGTTNFLSRATEEYIVLSDSDIVCNLDWNDVMKQHLRTEADITIVTVKANSERDELSNHIHVIRADDEGRIIDCSEYDGEKGNINISTNFMLMKRTYLLGIVRDAMAHGDSHFFRDVIYRDRLSRRFFAYRFEGKYCMVSSMASYFRANMELLDPEFRKGIFEVGNRPIYTKVRNSAPTHYLEGSKVTNSYIADGCVIEGTVENSIIFRGCKVGKGTTIRNSILMQDTYTGTDVLLNCVITDKNAVIKDGRMLSGCEERPYFLPKGTMV